MAASMKKLVKAVKGMKKTVDQINHPPFLSAIIPAGCASPAPPLGPQLGQVHRRTPSMTAIKLDTSTEDDLVQRNVQIANFCKDFNERTKDIKEGVPLPTRISVNLDRTYSLVIHKPPTSYYLRLAAGIKKGAMKPAQEIAGKVSLRHIYEIAKIKSEDPCWEHYSMEQICRSVIGTAHSCGIEVVKDLDAAEYGPFLEERRKVVEQQETELQEAKAAKLLRVAAATV